MAVPFLTGFTTRLKFSGAIVASTQTVEGGPDGTALADTASKLEIDCNGVVLTAYAYSKCDYGCQSNLIVTLSSPDGYSTSGHETDGDGSGPSSSINANGSWDVEFDVEEWQTTYIPASVSAVNGTYFPNYGGAAQGDGLPAIGTQFFLTLKPGGTFSSSINSGTVSLSHTFTISSPDVIGFLITPTVTTDASGGDSNVTSVGIQYNSTPIITTYHELATTSFGTNTVDATGGTVSAEVAIQGECQIVANVNPPIQFNLSGHLRSWASVYPGTAKVTWINGAGPTTSTLTPTLGSFSDSVTQNEWSCTGYYQSDLIGTHTPFPTVSLEQWQAPAIWLSNLGGGGGSGDDTHDWRMQFRGFQWPAVSLTRATTYELDNCSSLTHWTAGSNTTLALSGGVKATVNGGSGGATLGIVTAKQVWEAYRLLGVTCSFTAAVYDNAHTYSTGDVCLESGTVYRATASTTGHTPPNAMYWTPITVLPITASAGGATWTLNIPFTSGQIGLELPCGTTDVSTIGLVQTRFPIQYPGGFPINYPPVTQYSFGWGVNYANSVGFSAIPNGAIVTFSDVSLISETNASKQSAITFLETFLDFVTGWTSPTDTTTVQPFMILEADGKIIDMPGMALVTPSSGMSPPTYTFYTIAQMVTMYAYFPGLTISTLPDPSDGYHGSGLLAFLLGGSGDTYNWSTNQWTDWVDVNLPQTTIPAQDLWDEIQIYPGCGNPWGGTRSFGSPTPLRASKSLRGQANGLIYNTPGNLFSGVKVKVFETSSPTIGEGSGISDAIGKYYTLTPWLFGNVNSETQVQLPPNYYQTGVVQNRQRRRTSFRVQPVTLKNLDYDVSLQFRHGRVSANATTGTLWMGVSPNGDPYAWVDIDTGIPSTQGAVRWQDNGNVPFGILYAQPSSSNLLWVQTPDEGNTFTMATTISSTLATNGFFDFEECADFLRWFWWLEGSSAPYTIYVKCLDPQLNVIIPRTATNVTNSDLAEIRVKEYPQTGGARKFGLQYAVSGSVVFLTSPDGITWT